MKKLFLILLILLLPCSVTAEQKEVVISAGEWPPMLGRNLPHNGVAGHLIELAFKRSGYDVRFEFATAARAFYMLVNNEVDGSAYYYESAHRKEVALYSDPLIREKIVFYHFAGLPVQKWKKLSDLREWRIGVVNGYTYTEELWYLGKKNTLRLYPSNTPQEAFEKMARGRIDLFPESDITGAALIRELFAPGKRDVFSHSTKPLAVRTGHFLVSKTNPDRDAILRAFNRGLAAIKKDGTYDRLIRDMNMGKYDPPERQPSTQ